MTKNALRTPFWALTALLGSSSLASADKITLKSGVVYHGEIEKDNTLVSIFDLTDGLKRTVIRDSKIARTEVEGGPTQLANFDLIQPNTTHSGVMPTAVLWVKTEPWDKSGRRRIQYLSARMKTVSMTQAIIMMGPRVCKIRGVDGPWAGQIPTSQVPKPVLLGLLAKVDQKNADERIKVIRFMIQADWPTEAKREIERTLKDFAGNNDLVPRCNNALALVQEAEAQKFLSEIDVRRAAQQPRGVRARLKSFPTEGVPADLVVSARDQLRRDDTRAAIDKSLSEAIGTAMKDVANEHRLEILEGLSDAPDAVRSRFDAFEKARAEGSVKPETLAALALSGWIVGSELAVPDITSAEILWTARDIIRDYLTNSDENARAQRLATLKAMQIQGKPLSINVLSAIVRLMPPPVHDGQNVAPEKPTLLRVHDDPNPLQPSEYAVLLPPEYHPLRSYPTVIALHGDDTPQETLTWWAAEAQKRGYIVIAPEYNIRDQKHDYRYTESEHAAVELVLRDARKRFSIDPDRVFLGGYYFGGDMAWDFGLSHPDLFAGVIAVSGQPAKYVFATKSHASRVPMFIVSGEKALAEKEVLFDLLSKPLIANNYDVTYLQIFNRGREDFPEEATDAFDWMAPRRRDPYPKAFEIVAARECDDRFYGAVIREFAPDRIKDPVGVDDLGKNLKPARIEMKSSTLANLLNFTLVSGIRRLDVWISPKLIDFTQRMEVRVNTRSVFKGLPKIDLEAFLEDLRLRGDRSQIYFMRVPITLGSARN